jgi:SAM-dependent methyltransferase
MDTRAIGLDVGLSFAKWLTGAENLHYGDWTGLETTAANFGPAQVAYTDRLFRFLPDKPCRILDIGGGAGETARKLLALGHKVEIVIPSAFLAGRCRENAKGAAVHEMRFEDLEGEGKFDVCLFSESFQYIPLGIGLPKCLGLLAPGGRIVIADCFRREGFREDKVRATVGGGHLIDRYRAKVAGLGLETLSEEDITAEVAPSVEIEQGLFNVVGYALTRVDQELSAKRPRAKWLIDKVIRLFLDERKRQRLDQRLNQNTRNVQVFAEHNVYLMTALEPRS